MGNPQGMLPDLYENETRRFVFPRFNFNGQAPGSLEANTSEVLKFTTHGDWLVAGIEAQLYSPNPGDPNGLISGTLIRINIYDPTTSQFWWTGGSANENIGLLNEFLLADYEQSQALASKEDELNHMTDELTKRYEELNLIYKAEDQALNIYHGRELLRQLVSNTSRFLNVDVIFLYIAGKNIAMHKYKNDNPLFESDKLFHYLQNTVYPLIEKDCESIVVNHVDDAGR